MTDEELNSRFEALAELISHGFARVDERFEEVNTRFDAQAARLDRHAALWQTGTRWSAKQDAWNEKVDSALDQQAKLLADLRERLRKLESRNGENR